MASKHHKILQRLVILQAPIYVHTFNGPFSGTTRVSRYQKGKTSLDFTEARDSEWKWHQLDHMQVCTSLQTDNHASTPPLKFFTGWMPFLPPNQQRQSTEGTGYATLMPNSTIHTRPDSLWTCWRPARTQQTLLETRVRPFGPPSGTWTLLLLLFIRIKKFI